jgi:predicted RNA-binding Zn-ribbon protein involved in translation (DUF1610 family)
MSVNPECPSCNVEMVNHTVNLPMMGTSYPAMKCPKCGRVMMHQKALDKMNNEIYEEGSVNWPEVHRIMTKIRDIDHPDAVEEGVIHWRVRESTKYLIKSDIKCPRCGATEGVKIIKMWKSGKDMGCKCNFQWFYEYPEKK